MKICIDFRNGQGRCSAMEGVVSDSLSHSCLYCKEPIHAICGRELNDVERKSVPDALHERTFPYRACFACDASDEIRLGPAPPSIRKLQSREHDCFTSKQDDMQDSAHNRQALSSNRDNENACAAYYSLEANNGVCPVFDFEDTIMHDDSGEEVIQNLQYEWSLIKLTPNNVSSASEVEEIVNTVPPHEYQNVENEISEMHDVSGKDLQHNLKGERKISSENRRL